MGIRLTRDIVLRLPVPETGNAITYDSEVPGLGVRVTSTGRRSFILTYRTRAGRQRRATIGEAGLGEGDWTLRAARERARAMKVEIAGGADPLADLEAVREAPTIEDLCRHYAEVHLPRKRPGSRLNDEIFIRRDILPRWRQRLVSELRYPDMAALHREATKERGPTAANRLIALLSKMFALAIRQEWRADNPCRGIEKNPENRRQRYLTPDEIARLTAALADHADRQGADIVRLLLLTGARKGEVLAMRWADVALAAGVWTKPAATTKQRAEHRVPLSAPALQLLAGLREAAGDGAEYVFPGRLGGHRENIKSTWTRLCAAAGISGVRVHDLRHSFASVLAGAGLSLPVIGALLGHTQPATTARYAHLLDDPLRAATERAASVITRKPGAEVVDIREGRR